MKQIDFSDGKIGSNILQAALPMLVAQVLSLLYSIVRLYQVGIALGAGQLDAAHMAAMDLYFEAQNSPKRAKPLKNVTLAQLCEDYTKNDIGVMVWATTDMQEPVEDQSVWVVNYTDENAVTHEGDTFSWPGHEHCLVLIGYDETKYYFSDSVAGEVSSWDKALCEQRFQQLGSQAIVVL